MPNANIAERILSLVTTPDRAGATVGDLIESRVGALRFWFTIASQILRRATVPALVAFMAQFFLIFWAGLALVRFSSPSRCCDGSWISPCSPPSFWSDTGSRATAKHGR